MRISDLIYQPSGLEQELMDNSMPVPQRGFHTLYETRVWFNNEYGLQTSNALVAYAEGGANNGDRYTIVSVHGARREDDNFGWTHGFHLPVPARPIMVQKEFLRALAQQKSKPLLFVGDSVPGFASADGPPYIHKDGWFTRSTFSYEFTPEYWGGSPWGEGARFFRLREGIYVIFPDNTYRLVPMKAFFDFKEDVPAKRQGDLLVWESDCYVDPQSYKDNTRHQTLDRHQFSGEMIEFRSFEWGRQFLTISDGVFTHPEHEPIELKAGWIVSLAPGTSRPFAREGGAD